MWPHLWVFLILVVYIAHVDPQPSALRVLLVFHNQGVCVQRLRVHFVQVVLQKNYYLSGVGRGVWHTGG
jgi:ureidoglycolate hydrolase